MFCLKTTNFLPLFNHCNVQQCLFFRLKTFAFIQKSQNQSQNSWSKKGSQNLFCSDFWKMLALWTFVLYPDINNEQIGDIQIGLFCNHIWVKGCKNKIIQYTKRSLNIQSWGTGISNFVQIWSEKEVSSRTIKLRRKDYLSVAMIFFKVFWDQADYSSETMILNSFDKFYEFIFRITQVTREKFRFVVYLRHILFCPWHRHRLVFRRHRACHCQRHQQRHCLRH